MTTKPMPEVGDVQDDKWKSVYREYREAFEAAQKPVIKIEEMVNFLREASVLIGEGQRMARLVYGAEFNAHTVRKAAALDLASDMLDRIGKEVGGWDKKVKAVVAGVDVAVFENRR